MITTLTVLTILFSLIITFGSQPLVLYKMPNGIVEYFSSFYPEFVIKSYLNGSSQPALITVFVNLPNGMKLIEESFTQSLAIPFASLKPYMKYWLTYLPNRAIVNTSLLVIVTYFDNGKAYSSAEEIAYSPSWIINNYGMQIVASINVIGKTAPIN